MHDITEFFAQQGDEIIPMMAIGGSFIVALIWIVLATIHESIKSVARERTRREIAAYIAEGSMTPEQGERLMKAKPDAEESA